jgi:hypothetical protein
LILRHCRLCLVSDIPASELYLPDVDIHFGVFSIVFNL